MTGLPSGLRAALGRRFCFQPLRLEKQIGSTDRQTRKFLFLLPDGSLTGPGFSASESAGLPPELQRPGVVIDPGVAAIRG